MPFRCASQRPIPSSRSCTPALGSATVHSTMETHTSPWPGERGGRAVAGRTDDIRALALMTLGTTELWSLRLTDARRHLEEGLALARQIGRPYLEIGCLAHLGIGAPLSGLSPSAALAFSEEAVTIAEGHGLATNPIVALAFAIGAGSLAWLGRFDEAEQWLERAGPQEEIQEPSWPCTTRAAYCTPAEAGSRTRWPSSGTGRRSKGCSPASMRS
jgi:hypothetical protein